jgi:hypothetical protein
MMKDFRQVTLAALLAVFGVQFAWLFAMRHSCVVGVQSGGGQAAVQLCEIAASRFDNVSGQAKDIFLALLVPVGAGAAGAAAISAVRNRRGGEP